MLHLNFVENAFKHGNLDKTEEAWIQMPNLMGLELLKSLQNQPATIFTTTYSEYALDGFELGVVHYLLKSIEFDRFF